MKLIMEKENKNREELLLKLKEAMCKYTFFYKKKTPNEIYSPILASEKSLETALIFLKQLEELKKEKMIGYINPLSDGPIRFFLDNEKNTFSFEINDAGEISATETIKNIFNFKSAEEAKDLINKI